MKTRSLALLITAALLLGACSLPLMGNKGPAAQIHTYLLEWTPKGPAKQAPANAPVLLISPPRAAAGYTSSDLVYLKPNHELAHFAYHRWADAPAHMLAPLLQAAAEHSGRFSAVIPSGSQARADLRLDTQLLRLRQLFTGGQCEVELALRVELIDIASGRLLGGRPFSYREPCGADTPAAAVMTANRLVGEFAEALATWLDETVK